jgi:hypothetical protein
VAFFVFFGAFDFFEALAGLETDLSDLPFFIYTPPFSDFLLERGSDKLSLSIYLSIGKS